MYQPGTSIIVNIMKQKLKRLLAHRQKQVITDSERVASAVLLPLYRHQGCYHLVFIRRTETVKSHKRQISFPGGTYEEGDENLLNTALRESQEEIGLRVADVEVLGELDDEVTSTSNFIVSPFVCLMPWPYHFHISPDEVDEIIRIPIAALLEEGCLKPHPETLNGKRLESYAYHYDGKVIWGATARILKRFLEIFTRVMQEE